MGTELLCPDVMQLPGNRWGCCSLCTPPAIEDLSSLKTVDTCIVQTTPRALCAPQHACARHSLSHGVKAR